MQMLQLINRELEKQQKREKVYQQTILSRTELDASSPTTFRHAAHETVKSESRKAQVLDMLHS